LLSLLLKRVLPGTMEICAMCSSVSEGIDAIEKFNPSLVFLDIEMPNESGFSLFEKLTVINFEVIFTTAYSKYAIDAFKVNALDYILKPIEPQALLKAIRKTLNKGCPSLSNTEHIERADLRNLSMEDRSHDLQGDREQSNRCEKIMVPAMDGIKFFPLSEIIRMVADGTYTRIFFKTLPVFLSSKNLGEYEEKLSDNKNFMRIHRSTIVNTNEVVQLADARQILMSDGAVVNVSRCNKETFLNRMKRSCVESKIMKESLRLVDAY